MAALVATRLLGSAAQAFLLVLLARSTSVPSFGIVVTVAGVIEVVNVFADLGMTNLVSKARASNQDGVIRSALRLNVLTSASCWLLASTTLFAVFGLTVTTPALILLAGAAAIEKTSNTLSSIPMADGKPLSATLSFLCRRITSIPMFVLLQALWSSAAVVNYGLALFAGAVLGQAVLRRRIRPEIRSLSATQNSPLKAVVYQGASYFTGNLTMQLRSLDVAVVALVTGTSGSAFYGAAAKLTAPLLFVPAALAQVLLPRSTRMSRVAAREVGHRLLLATLCLFVAALPAAAFAKPIISLLLGPTYAPVGGVVLVFLILGMPFVGLSSAFGALLQGQDDERFVAGNGIAFSVVMLILVALGAFLGGPPSAGLGLALAFIGKSASLWLRIRRLDRDPCAIGALPR